MDEKRFRNRKFRMVLYPEDSSHAACMELLKSAGYQFAAVLHDKDVWTEDDPKYDPDKHTPGEPKKPHWHVVLKFINAKWNTAVAKELNIPENYILPCEDLNASLLYLVHEGYPEKHQYDGDEVFGPLKPSLLTLLTAQSESERALKIFEMIDCSPGFVSYTEVFRKACYNGLYSDFRRMGSGVVQLINEHNHEVRCALEPQENLRRDLQRRTEAGKRFLNDPQNWVYKCSIESHGNLPEIK